MVVLQLPSSVSSCKTPVKRQGAILFNFKNDTALLTPLKRWNVKLRAIGAITEHRHILFPHHA